MKSLLRPLGKVPLSAWAAGVFGLLIYLILPGQVIVLNDDFGYLRSILETLQRGRPWTDDWLEPWSASLSVLSAVIFKITGSFHVATCGLQAIFAAAAFAAIDALFRERGLSRTASIVAGAAVLLCPTLLWKELEFTGVAFYLPCFLWAIWAAEKNRWGLFFVFWVFAVASRQSAVTWLVLPACAWVSSPRQPAVDGKKRLHTELLVLLVGALAVFALLSLGMNKSHSQAAITDHLFERLEVSRALHQLVVGLVVALGFVGIGAFILSWRIRGLESSRAMPWKIAMTVALGLLAIVSMTGTQVVQLEHGSYGGSDGRLYIVLLWTAGLAGWLMSRFSVRWEMLAAALGSLLLVCLRHDVWDYYYMDVAIFSLLSVVPGAAMPEPAMQTCWPVAASRTVIAIVGVLSVLFVFEFKMSIDRSRALCVIGEKSLRNQSIAVTELGNMPFGFIGWHLHPHYVEHEGKNDPHIAGFTGYLKPDAIEVRMSRVRFWRDSKSLLPVVESGTTRVLATEVFSVGWFWWQRCTLLRRGGVVSSPSRLKLDIDKYRRRPFPLVEAEWRGLASPPTQATR